MTHASVKGMASIGCPDVLCMVYSDDQALPQALADRAFTARPGSAFEDSQCGVCGDAVPRLFWRQILNGYHCNKCHFKEVNGILALSRWDGLAPSPGDPRPTGKAHPGPWTMIFTSGADLLARGFLSVAPKR